MTPLGFIQRSCAKPTPGGEPAGHSQGPRNRPLDTFIAFRGCRADRTGKCRAAVTDHVAGVTLHTQQDITVTK